MKKALSFLLFCTVMLKTTGAFSQCTCSATNYASIDVNGWTVGQSGTITTCQYGGERATISNTVAGAVYLVSTCGAGYDTQLSIYTTGCSFVSGGYNDDNGPGCSGTAASVQFTSPGGNLYSVMHQYSCATNSTCTNVYITLVSLPCAAPANPGFGINQWYAVVWNAGNASGDAGAWINNYSGYYTIPSLSFDTRTGQTYSTAQSWDPNGTPSSASGYNGCPVGVDNHSYAFKRQGFPCSQYRINVPTHDDESRLFINGVQVWQHDNGCCDAHANIWTGYLGPTSQLEYRVSEGGGGSHGSLEFINLGAPPMVGFGNGVWNVLAYEGGDINLTGTYHGYYTEGNLSYNSTNRWGSGASPSSASGYVGCPVSDDYHVVVSKRTNFACGYYRLDIPLHDDHIKVFVNGNEVFDHVSCCDAHTGIWTGWLGPSSTIEVRHQEGVGGSTQGLSVVSLGPPGFGDGFWNTIGYNGGNINLTGSYAGYYTENSLSYNTLNRWCTTCSPSDAIGWQGCSVGVDNHVVVSKRTNFACGKYQLDMPNHDDDVRVYVNGGLVWSHEPGCCDVHTNIWTGYLNPSSTIEVRHLEGGGGSHQSLTLNNITPTITNGNMTINGTAGNLTLCESARTITIAQNGGSFGDANYYYWIGYDNGSGWVNSWTLMEAQNANVPSFTYTLPGPGSYVIHTNATNTSCSNISAAGVTRLVTVNPIAAGYTVDYSQSGSSQSVTVPASSGTGAIGATAGGVINFTSSVTGGSWPLCTNWGLPRQLKVIDANHASPTCSIPLADADAIVTFNPTDAATNLTAGNICFTGVTSFVGTNCNVRMRIQVRTTTGNLAVPFQTIGDYVMCRMNNNVTVTAWIEVQAPSSGLSYYGTTAIGGSNIVAGSSWHAVNPFFDNILGKIPSNRICTSFYFDWAGSGLGASPPFGAGFFKINGIAPTAAASPNPYCTTAPVQTTLALTGGIGTATSSCGLSHEWRTTSTSPASYSGSQVSTAQSPTGLSMAANTYHYILSSSTSNVCFGTSSVTTAENIGNPTSWTGLGSTGNNNWYDHSNWDRCVPDNTKNAIINYNAANQPSINVPGAKAQTILINTPAGAKLTETPACTPWPCLKIGP